MRCLYLLPSPLWLSDASVSLRPSVSLSVCGPQAVLSASELEDYKEAFELFKDGESVPSAKLGTVLRSLGFCPTEQEVTEMAAEAGASLSFDGLTACIATAKAKTPSHDELMEALKAFDHSGSGTIRTADLKCGVVVSLSVYFM